MGTRNLICVIKDGEFRVAQYSQWDGYPTGQGKTIVNFLLTQYNYGLFRSQIDKVKHLNDVEVKKRWMEAGAVGLTGGVSMEVANKMDIMYPTLSRGCGADILPLIQARDNPEVHMSLHFAADSLFCEYAYIVNLDTNVLEVYKGFNQEPLQETDRFYFLSPKLISDYYPVKLVKTYKFEDLTSSSMEELEEELNPNDDEDE